MVDLNATLIAQIINFLLLVAILAKFAYKPLMKALEDRQNRIASDIQTAEQERAAAEQLKREYQDNLAQARAQAQAIVEKAVKQAEQEAQDQLREVRVQIERERKLAQEEIVREREKALAELRGEVVALSIAAAGKLIAKNMDDQANSKLVSDFIEKLDEQKIGGLPC